MFIVICFHMFPVDKMYGNGNIKESLFTGIRKKQGERRYQERYIDVYDQRVKADTNYTISKYYNINSLNFNK